MSIKKGDGLKAVRLSAPDDVVAIRRELANGFKQKDSQGRQIGSARCGVYAFYDYDEEPIYVGQTRAKDGRLSERVSRHITNQRTDAVAMSVLDPFEVCDIELWPFFELRDGQVTTDTLNRAEYRVYQELVARSRYGAVLNEKPPRAFPRINLPSSFRIRIIPKEIYQARLHPDIRIARRASTIAKLAQVISERSVNPGLRNTLLTQTIRLHDLARQRLEGAPKMPASKEEAEEMKSGRED